MSCNLFNPDNIFRRFKVVEFPITFLGLSTILELDVDADLNVSAYLKTNCNGNLVKFDDARKISASHRAFHITVKNNHVIQITFSPNNECISRAKHDKHFDNMFVFDLRLIKIDGSHCCYNEHHSEIGRYYISGQFENCKISHSPDTLDFEDIIINTKIKKYLRLRNESNMICAQMQYVKIAGVEVTPEIFTISPRSLKKVTVTIRPTSLLSKNVLQFKLIHAHDVFDENNRNFLEYSVKLKLRVIYKKISKEEQYESLHKLYEKNPDYTYVGTELLIRNKRRNNALNSFKSLKKICTKVPVSEKYSTNKNKCYPIVLNDTRKVNFCENIKETASIYDLLKIEINPITINFGRVGTHTFGENIITIYNGTKFEVDIEFIKDKFILYSKNKKATLGIKVKPLAYISITIFSAPRVDGNFSGSFQYCIDKTFYRSNTYTLQVGTPTLMTNEKSLKFGMVTIESFVTSVPIKIHNNFNLSVDFKLNELQADIPFEIIPSSGTIPRHSSRICDVQYVSKISKTKTYEIDLLSISDITRSIPFELSIITRKLSIKFLQGSVTFKDISLNLETIEKVKLENSSRELAVFHVMEPLIPGIKIEPMCGSIRPKMIMSFDIIVKISCVLEFAFDVCLKINNKDNVMISVSGNVVEPKISLHPKNIFMDRIPCYMISYVPVTFHNSSNVKSVVEVLKTDDENIFDVYVLQVNERKRIFEFTLEGGQTKIVFIKVYDSFRREYDMFIPFRINGLLGPPNNNSCSTELRFYTGNYEKCYENNSKVKIKPIHKDISFCRISGVITVPWISFSIENFELEYVQNSDNAMNFSMTNISKYNFYVTIQTSKLSPNFTLNFDIDEIVPEINENYLKFELNCGKNVNFTLKFHPKLHGKFVSTALLYLDKAMSIPYYNLTFTGKKRPPVMYPNIYRIIFPPCPIGEEVSRSLTLKMEGQSHKDLVSCNSEEKIHLIVEFIDSEIELSNNTYYTNTYVKITALSEINIAKSEMLYFKHENGSECEVEVCFCFTHCPLTLHSQLVVKQDINPYPYYPLNDHDKLFNYMETCCSFLEKWMFQQGFRRDLFPIIPDTFHAISSAISSQAGYSKSKGINITYLNFIRRIAGPLMKHVRKIAVDGVSESFKYVKEIHSTYQEILNLLKSRGANLWILKAKFLLSFEQFVIYNENVTPNCNADILITKELIADVTLFNRLNKQSWIDFILQSYKVFVMDTCFFECVCVSTQSRDMLKIIIDWYNENISKQHNNLRGKNKRLKILTNITTDLADGIALISVILNYCPFISDHFQLFCDTDENTDIHQIINNACLIIDAINVLRINFPLSSKDLLEPNFLQMLFLSIHLYIVLPTFAPKDIIKLNPPLLKSSSRQLTISPSIQETLIFNYVILNNLKSNFSIERVPANDNGKKLYLSVKYTANFVAKEIAILLVCGYNKSRLFDTYMVFILQGNVGALNPFRKCKVTGPLYRTIKVDMLIASPFTVSATYKLFLTDIEPDIPVHFEEMAYPKFYVKRLHLIDKEINLNGIPRDNGQEIQEQKLFLQITCLNSQIGNTWLWFRSDMGEFFIRITTQPRWDLALDTLEGRIHMWPLAPCSCGEICECYRTTVVMIPHFNELMLKSLRYALIEEASEVMMEIFDNLIESATGRVILLRLLKEGGTNLSEVQHILRSNTTFRITSRALLPRLEKVTLSQHSGAFLPLPITISAQERTDKYSITLTSECGMDIRTYRIIFMESLSE